MPRKKRKEFLLEPEQVQEIRNFLINHNIKQKFVGDELGINEVTISKWLNGVEPPPKLLWQYYQLLRLKEKVRNFDLELCLTYTFV